MPTTDRLPLEVIAIAPALDAPSVAMELPALVNVTEAEPASKVVGLPREPVVIGALCVTAPLVVLMVTPPVVVIAPKVKAAVFQ